MFAIQIDVGVTSLKAIKVFVSVVRGRGDGGKSANLYSLKAACVAPR